MRFKNYRNSHTNEDTIYSKKNIADMSVREAFSRKDEIMAQHDAIGIPSEGELQSSPNAVWVEAYTRDDGTEVRGHWRSRPEGSSAEPENHQTTKDVTKENIIDSLLQENLDSFRYQNNNNTSINTTETIGNNVNNTDNNKGNLTDLNEKIMKLILKDY